MIYFYLVDKAAVTLQFFTILQIKFQTFILLLGHEDDLSRLERGPLVSLNVIRDGSQEAENANYFDQQLLAIIVLRLGCPLEERGHILGQLTLCWLCAILILNYLDRR